MPKIIIKKEAKEVIIDVDDQGGFRSGRCFACRASGWLVGLGFPHKAKNVPESHLKHGARCPMNKVLNDEGSLKSQKTRK